ncbi:MAG TPA: DUF6531 domain-containing protein, partial [Candidatus Limnocylindrales bacterium]
MQGTAGRRLTVAVPTYENLGTVLLYDTRGRSMPLASPLTPAGTTSGILPVSGTYTVLIDNSFGSLPGSAEIAVRETTDVEATATVDGGPTRVTTDSAGQHAIVYFDAEAGDRVRVAGGPFPALTSVTLVDPYGMALATAAAQSSESAPLFEPFDLNADGRYFLDLDPDRDAVGAMTIEISGAAGALGRDGGGGSAAGSHDAVSPTRATSQCPAGPVAVPLSEALPTTWRPSDEEVWRPTAANLAGDWSTHRQPSPWEWTAALMATPLTTAVSGRVLRLDGLPLAGVRVTADGAATCTDASGRFLLGPLSAGPHELVIDGSPAASPGRAYGTVELGALVVGGQTNVLPFTIWMSRVDTGSVVRVPKHLRTELVVTNPSMPGLELRIPAGSHLVDSEGQPVTEMGLTPVPIDRPPFPLPPGAAFPMYFTVDPHGVVVAPEGATVVYPNVTRKAPGSPASFWYYEPEEGWENYGGGSVAEDGRSVVPAHGIALDDLGFSAFIPGESLPVNGPVNGQGCCATAGEPVDLASGVFLQQNADLAIADVMPLDVGRTYRSADPTIRSFGLGTTHQYNMYLSAAANTPLYLVLPDGTGVPYKSIGPGPFFGNLYEHRASPTRFHGSRIFFAADLPQGGWWLVMRDGSRFLLGQHAALQEVRDRNGNAITITRVGGAEAPASQVTSPGGRWISLTYDDPAHATLVTSASDVAGREVGYAYDERQRLTAVTDADGGVTRYEYDEVGNMTSVTTPRGIALLRNEYDDGGRVVRQTQADGGVHAFAYTVTGERISESLYTDPLGHRRRISFNE